MRTSVVMQQSNILISFIAIVTNGMPQYCQRCTVNWRINNTPMGHKLHQLHTVMFMKTVSINFRVESETSNFFQEGEGTYFHIMLADFDSDVMCNTQFSYPVTILAKIWLSSLLKHCKCFSLHAVLHPVGCSDSCFGIQREHTFLYHRFWGTMSQEDPKEMLQHFFISINVFR